MKTRNLTAIALAAAPGAGAHNTVLAAQNIAGGNHSIADLD